VKEGNENRKCKLFQLSLNDAFRSTVSLQGWKLANYYNGGNEVALSCCIV